MIAGSRGTLVDGAEEFSIAWIFTNKTDQYTKFPLRNGGLRDDIPVPVVGVEESRTFVKRVHEVATFHQEDGL